MSFNQLRRTYHQPKGAGAWEGMLVVVPRHRHNIRQSQPNVKKKTENQSQFWYSGWLAEHAEWRPHLEAGRYDLAGEPLGERGSRSRHC